MQIKTGKGPVNLMAVVAIWSLSLSVDLPGLAITPMLTKLQAEFGNASQLMIQLITILPNLLIIPFVLLSGRLSRSNHKIAIIVWGLLIYLAAGILYFIFHSLVGLLLISCLLGVGCGLLLPFSTGLIADVFVGKYRMKQMGIISAIGNLAVVVATYVVGWLAAVNTTLPFLVYLIPAISLVLMPFMHKLPKADLYSAPQPAAAAAAAPAPAPAETAAPAPAPASKSEAKAHAVMAAPAAVTHKAAAATMPTVDADGFSTAGQTVKNGFYVGRSVWLCVTYFFWVFVTEIISYYVPYLMSQYGMSTQAVGTVTAIFFLSMFLVGVAITPVLKCFRKWTYVVSMVLLAAGFVLFLVSKNVVVFCVAAALLGLSDGTCQPIIYDKATEMCSTQNRATMALAIILSVNYLAIVTCPFITDFARSIFGIKSTDGFYNLFPFLFDLVLTGICLICVLVRKNGFSFGIHKEYYE